MNLAVAQGAIDTGFSLALQYTLLTLPKKKEVITVAIPLYQGANFSFQGRAVINKSLDISESQILQQGEGRLVIYRAITPDDQRCTLTIQLPRCLKASPILSTLHSPIFAPYYLKRQANYYLPYFYSIRLRLVQTLINIDSILPLVIIILIAYVVATFSSTYTILIAKSPFITYIKPYLITRNVVHFIILTIVYGLLLGIRQQNRLNQALPKAALLLITTLEVSIKPKSFIYN